MRENIREITEKLQAAAIEELPVLLIKYTDDERTGVRSAVDKGRRRILAYEMEVARSKELQKYEQEYAAYEYVCGIDEVGRGPLAGPVVAGAVILPKNCDILYINDSKKLSEKKREELYDIIIERAVSVGIGYSTPERIDEINILQATYEAMREAIGKLAVMPDLLLNDAVTIPQVSVRQVPIIKGDAKSISISAASIVAKVTRDRLMVQYDEVYPEYGFASNKGYGAQVHVDALRKYGPCPIHRRSFITHFCETE